MEKSDNLLFIEEFAGKLKVTSSAISQWIKTGQLPQEIFLEIGRIRIRKKVFESYYNVDLDNILTYKETAEILRTSEDNVKTLFSRKKLPEELRFKLVGIVRVKGDLLNKLINGG